MSVPASFDTRLRLDDLDPARPEPIETPWGSFALYLVGGRILCSQSFCPHLDGPLFQGTLSGATITCPWHQWRFSLETGRRVDAVGQLNGGRPCLEVCETSLGPEGTIVLAAPRR